MMRPFSKRLPAFLHALLPPPMTSAIATAAAVFGVVFSGLMLAAYHFIPEPYRLFPTLISALLAMSCGAIEIVALVGVMRKFSFEKKATPATPFVVQYLGVRFVWAAALSPLVGGAVGILAWWMNTPSFLAAVIAVTAMLVIWLPPLNTLQRVRSGKFGSLEAELLELARFIHKTAKQDSSGPGTPIFGNTTEAKMPVSFAEVRGTAT